MPAAREMARRYICETITRTRERDRARAMHPGIVISFEEGGRSRAPVSSNAYMHSVKDQRETRDTPDIVDF